MTSLSRTHPFRTCVQMWTAAFGRRHFVPAVANARRVWASAFAVLLLAAVPVRAADAVPPSPPSPTAAVQRDLLDGNYQDAIKAATAGVRDNPTNVEWTLLLTQALLAVGRNTDADVAIREAISRDDQSIRLRWAAREIALANGRPEESKQRLTEIRRLFEGRMWNYRTPPDLVVFGRVALLLGADPKDVLEKVYGVAQKGDPKLRDVYLARGDLALEKHDFALAARAYEDGLKQLPDDPDLLSGRALAYADGEREIAIRSLTEALKRNPRHIPTLLQFADHHIDAEAYEEANKVLEKIIEVNPSHPDAWSYRAVLSHLHNDFAGEEVARTKALSSWARNPRVDHLIGQKLSAKYRFAEGAAYQRRARAFDAEYLPAMSQLANDLLRLGEEAEGWKLAHAVHEKDDYDVEAFNLVTLHDTMEKYAALTNEDFVVRMSTKEVAVYGPRVLALLRKAKQNLVEKYGVELAKPTYVEIFADQRDFAVRTFGLPDVAGFLGVCFGRVVTANSPATSSSPTSWESVLWHEFCHVVTLQMTKNKMPRWLSEGISVYEERLADPSWGMRLNPRYRQMIMDGELAPVGKMSGAFLAPKTPQHLQFAYLQSSMVVEFIIKRFGQAAIRGVLEDLRNGIEINAALAKRTVPLEQLEPEFEKYAKDMAEQLAPKLNWEKPDPELLMAANAEEYAAWEKKYPDNYYALRLQAQRAAQAQKWDDARKPLERLVELYPQQKGPDAPYRSLVVALRSLGDTAGEREALKKWTAFDDEASDGFLRLMELAAAEKDWPTVARTAEKYLGVNPLVPAPYRYAAQASTELNDLSTATLALQTLLQLDVPEAPEIHFKLAQLLHKRGQNSEAQRHVLSALEETPRYREALRLLVDIKRARAEPPPAPAAPPSPATVTPPPADSKPVIEGAERIRPL